MIAAFLAAFLAVSCPDDRTPRRIAHASGAVAASLDRDIAHHRAMIEALPGLAGPDEHPDNFPWSDPRGIGRVINGRFRIDRPPLFVWGFP